MIYVTTFQPYQETQRPVALQAWAWVVITNGSRSRVPDGFGRLVPLIPLGDDAARTEAALTLRRLIKDSAQDVAESGPTSDRPNQRLRHGGATWKYDEDTHKLIEEIRVKWRQQFATPDDVEEQELIRAFFADTPTLKGEDQARRLAAAGGTRKFASVEEYERFLNPPLEGAGGAAAATGP